MAPYGTAHGDPQLRHSPPGCSARLPPFLPVNSGRRPVLGGEYRHQTEGPHPGTESAAKNLTLGPIAAVADRTRDAVRKAMGKDR